MGKSLTRNKQNKVVADWKTGEFPSYSAIARKHKISDKTAKKLVYGIPFRHSEIVNAGEQYEKALVAIGDPVQIRSIKEQVKKRSTEEKIHAKVIEATMINVKGVRTELRRKIFKKGQKPPNMLDRVRAQDVLDKALITSGQAERHAPRVSVEQNQQANLAVLTSEEICKSVAKSLPD